MVIILTALERMVFFVRCVRPLMIGRRTTGGRYSCRRKVCMCFVVLAISLSILSNFPFQNERPFNTPERWIPKVLVNELTARRNIMVSRITLFKRKSSQPSAFRKEDKKRTLKGFFRYRRSKTSKKQSSPSLPQHQSQTLTWTLSELSNDSHSITPENDAQRRLPCQILQPSYSQEAVDSLKQRHAREVEALQQQISSIQQTAIEHQSTESDYHALCDEYERIAREQELEISKKECKIVYLNRLMEALEYRNADETQQRKELEQTVSNYEIVCAQHEQESREQKLELFKRELEIKFMKGMNESLLLHGQAEKDLLNDEACKQEKVIHELKEELAVVTEKRLAQAENIDCLNEKIHTILRKQERAAARSRAKEMNPTKSSKRQWSIWDELTVPNL